MPKDFFPEQGEIVIATVKKITQFGAFCSLDEHSSQDAFIHVSEVSSGWVRSVRDHVKEGQKIVALILRVDPVKRQVDLSLKRISEAEKKRKMEAYNLDKRALKLLERAALKIGKKATDVNEVIPLIKEKYGDLYTAFEQSSEGKEISELPKKWAEAISEVAKQEIKPKFVTQRATIRLKSYAPDGLNRVKKVLKSIESSVSKDVKAQLHYVGAPVYYLDLTAADYKIIEKTITKLKTLFATSTDALLECEITG